MDNTILKDLIIFGIIIIIAAILLSLIFAPSSDAKATNIDILNKGDLGSNSTVYIKLTDLEKNSLSNKTVNVKLIDKSGKAVYNKSIKTHATGVGMAKLSNISAGNYTLNITYEGDANYTSCSISKEVTVEEGVVEDIIDNSTLDAADLQDIADTQVQQQQDAQQYSQTDYTPINYDSQSDSSQSSDSGYDTYYDENGNEMDVIIDENGYQVDPTETDEE